MNKYLNKVNTNSSIVKQAEKSEGKELRDTGIIGGIGVGSSLITNHVQDSLGLNGAKSPKVKNSVSLLNRVRSNLTNPIKTIKNVVGSSGFKRSAKIGAIGGAIGLAGDYAAVKINHKLEKKSEDTSNKFLDQLAPEIRVQNYKTYGGDPVNDTSVAKINTVINYASKPLWLHGIFTPAVARYGNHLARGRDLKGAIAEETRAGTTSFAKSLGYGLAGGVGVGLAGAGIGALAGNKRVAKLLSNILGKVGAKVNNYLYVKKATPGDVLGLIGASFPKETASILGYKHLGSLGGSILGAGAGVLGGGVVGAVKGNYDGRLSSIRNQINDGRLSNVINTEYDY